MPRILELTDDKKAIIVEAVSNGATTALAAAAAGLARQTLRNWLIQGESDVEDGDVDTVYAKLYIAVSEAEAEYAEDMLSHIRDAAADPKEWRAAAWLLTRRFPDDFGSKATTQVDVNHSVDWKNIIESARAEFEEDEDVEDDI